MKKHLVYYTCVPVAFLLFLWLASQLLRLMGVGDNLGMAIAGTFGMCFVGFPVVICALMRFSMLPWVLDPFAAVLPPVSLLAAMLCNVYGTHHWEEAIMDLTLSLRNDGGEGVWFLIGMFLWGLLCSFSLRRAKGDHLPGRILKHFRK